LNKNAQTKYAQTPMAKVAMIAGQMAWMSQWYEEAFFSFFCWWRRTCWNELKKHGECQQKSCGVNKQWIGMWRTRHTSEWQNRFVMKLMMMTSNQLLLWWQWRRWWWR
jgi:hypothetical protein